MTMRLWGFFLKYPDYAMAMVMKSKDNDDFVNKLVALRETKYKNDIEFGKICDAIMPEKEE